MSQSSNSPTRRSGPCGSFVRDVGGGCAGK